MKRYILVVILACCVGILIVGCCESFAQDDHADGARRVVKQDPPVYPELAEKMHIWGTVKLEIVVAPNGSPKSAKPLGGHPILVQAATDAVNKWKWAPSPRETTESVSVKFDPR